jgi:hypothetical protein
MKRTLRSLCEAQGIPVDSDKSLHSLFGEYVKKLESMNVTEDDQDHPKVVHLGIGCASTKIARSNACFMGLERG